MRLLKDEQRLPNIGEVCVIRIKDIKKLDITTGIDGVVTPNSNGGLREDNLEEKAKLYEIDYSFEFDDIDELSELDECDSTGSYRLVFNNVEGNDTELKTFVEYLGDGIFRDVISNICIRAYCDEYTSGMINQYSCDESSNICEAFYDVVLDSTTSRDLINNRESLTKMPLIIDLNTTDLLNVDASSIRDIMAQGKWEEINCICSLNAKAKKDLNRQIDLLPKMDEHLAYVENEFRRGLK